jgi:ABC-type glycerol-3-phosphate transport system permease component
MLLIVIKYVLLGIIAMFAALPFLWMLSSSFQPLSVLRSPDASILPTGTATLDAYRDLLLRYPYERWFLNSILVAGGVVAGNVVFDTLAAYALSRLRFRGRGAVFAAVLATLMVPTQVILVPLYLFINTLGWIDSYRALIIPFLVSPTGIFLLRQHFVTLPKELDEAAAIDGLGRVGTLVRVLLPNSLAILGTVVVLKFMWTWGEFAWPSIATTSQDMATLPVGLARFQSQLDPQWHLLMAGSVMAVLPLVIMYAFLQRYFVRGLTAGTVKG